MDSYYKGMSLGTIQKEIDQRHGAYYAQSSIYNWILRFSKESIELAKTFHPTTGDMWYLCIIPIKTEKRQLYFMDIFDVSSKFLIASRLFEDVANQTLIKYIKSAFFTVNSTHHPIIVSLPDDITDSESFSRTWQRAFSHKIIFKIADKETTAQFNDLLKKRRHVVHSFKNLDNSQILTGAWQVQYNFITGNEKAPRIPPAHKIGIISFRTWSDIISQSMKN